MNATPNDTDNFRALLRWSHGVAAEMASSVTGTEHLLLALVRNDNDPVVPLLKSVGVTAMRLRALVPRNVEIFAAAPVANDVELPFTPSAQRAIHGARVAARELAHPFVEPAHLVLSLLALPDCTAGRILAEVPGVAISFPGHMAYVYPQGAATADPQPIHPALNRSWHPTRRQMEIYPQTHAVAAARGHDYLGVEHLFFVLVRLDGGQAVIMLERLGMDMAVLQRDTLKLIGPETVPVTEPPRGNEPTTPALKAALAAAIEESATIGSASLTTGDLLLGLLREPDSAAALVKAYPALTLEAARRERRRLSE